MKNTINTKLFNRIAKKITEHPEKFDMGAWLDWGDEGYRSGCGTIACIGGWAVLLSKSKLSESTQKKLEKELADHKDGTWRWASSLNFRKEAQKLLGLSKTQADNLFDVASWPKPFYEKYREVSWKPGSMSNYRKMAKIAVKRINYLLEKGL